MSDWYGHSRSNYFKVKDVEKFKDFLSKWNADYISTETKVLAEKCRKCLNGQPDIKCKNYIASVVGECKGKTKMTMLHGFLGSEDSGALPNFYEDEATGKEYDFDDFTKELSTHLADGWVAVMQEIGAEKLRYITGFAMAVNSNGKSEIVNIEAIYNKAQSLGSEITKCEG